jgi:hypothetical protein
MTEIEKTVRDLETAETLSVVRDQKSAIRVKMLSIQLDSQFDALESLLTVNHEETMRALKPSDKVLFLVPDR